MRAGLLYLGSGLGLARWRALRRSPRLRLQPGAWIWLAGAVLCGGVVAPVLLLAAALMGLGIWLHLTEQHAHPHTHEAMKHEHGHGHDLHHDHHAPGEAVPRRHTHRHAAMTHSHAHFPGKHHRHPH